MPTTRSSFPVKAPIKTAIAGQLLYPLVCEEMLPGDTFDLRAHLYGRLATPIFPVMDNLYLDTFWFFTPNRLVWDNWVKLQGERRNPTDSVDYMVPHLFREGGSMSFEPLSLHDYFGLPTQEIINPLTHPISALPFRMLNLIWNEWFRDQDLQDSLEVPMDDGPDPYNNYNLQPRGKSHDYFTSARPEAQKGDAVSIPLGAFAPVIGDGNTLGFLGGYGMDMGISSVPGEGYGRLTTDTYGTIAGTPNTWASGSSSSASISMGVTSDPTRSGLVADLSLASAATINVLREAFVLQQMRELDMRGGTRYSEILISRFGVHAGDDRLQRPEYVAGSSQRITISAVPQTSETTGTGSDIQPTGSISAYGTVGDSSVVHYSAVEHGFLICLVNVRADLTYQQKLDKKWTRQVREDFYEPLTAHLGEQPVLCSELYFSGDDTYNTRVFGFQERWAEYRFLQAQITGPMRSNYAQSLDAWHYALDDIDPVLGPIWIRDNPPILRTQAVQTEPPLILDGLVEGQLHRLIPRYGTPGLTRL